MHMCFPHDVFETSRYSRFEEISPGTAKVDHFVGANTSANQGLLYWRATTKLLIFMGMLLTETC